jgi:sodium-dependent phosphate cotransporter
VIFPIPLCKKLGKITATYRWFAIVYVVGMFFVMPGFFVLLTMIDSKGITMYTFMLIIFVLITGSMTINWMQSNTKPANELLPEKLRNWEFLPEPLKSFEPYDRLLTGCSCCPTADDLEAQKVDEVELQEQKSGGIDNPSMDYKQF